MIESDRHVPKPSASGFDGFETHSALDVRHPVEKLEAAVAIVLATRPLWAASDVNRSGKGLDFVF